MFKIKFCRPCHGIAEIPQCIFLRALNIPMIANGLEQLVGMSRRLGDPALEYDSGVWSVEFRVEFHGECRRRRSPDATACSGDFQ